MEVTFGILYPQCQNTPAKEVDTAIIDGVMNRVSKILTTIGYILAIALALGFLIGLASALVIAIFGSQEQKSAQSVAQVWAGVLAVLTILEMISISLTVAGNAIVLNAVRPRLGWNLLLTAGIIGINPLLIAAFIFAQKKEQ